MEKVIVRRKEFEIVKTLNETDFLVSYKDKQYLLKRFGEDIEKYQDTLYQLKRLFNSGVPCYKVFRIDKKTHDIVLTHQPGETVYELLLKGPLEDNVYAELFRVNYVARQNRCFLNYLPNMWTYYEDKLYYLGFNFEPLTEKNKNNLVDVAIKYWYHTKIFRDFAKENGDFVDNKLFKTEFEANKEILLLTCKHYR